MLIRASNVRVCEAVEASAESISAFAEFGVLFADRADAEIDAAHVFWSPDVNPAIIDVRVVAEFPQAGGAMFRLHSIADRVVRLASADMQDQLLVIDGARQVQINCIDGDIAAPGCVLVPQIAPDRNINAQMLSIRRLLGLYRERSFPESLFKPDTKSDRLHEVLTALDGWLAGLSSREIALRLYGAQLVNADWAPEGGYLIERVRRTIRRGRTLAAAGYRSLLA